MVGQRRCAGTTPDRYPEPLAHMNVGAFKRGKTGRYAGRIAVGVEEREVQQGFNAVRSKGSAVAMHRSDGRVLHQLRRAPPCRHN